MLRARLRVLVCCRCAVVARVCCEGGGSTETETLHVPNLPCNPEKVLSFCAGASLPSMAATAATTRSDSWMPPPGIEHVLVEGSTSAPEPSGGTSTSSEEQEVTELVALFSAPSHHSPSARPPLKARRPLPASLGTPLPAWDSTPHRNRPTALKGLRSSTTEPWTKCEDLNHGLDAHIEWRTTHKNLIMSGAVPVEELDAKEHKAKHRSEQLGNRLLRQEKRLAAARRKAKAQAIARAREAEEATREAERQARRGEIEEVMRQQARQEDAVLAVELERLRKAAEAAAAEEAARRAEEERLKAEAEAAAEKERFEAEQAEKAARAQAAAAAKETQQATPARGKKASPSPAQGKKKADAKKKGPYKPIKL